MCSLIRQVSGSEPQLSLLQVQMDPARLFGAAQQERGKAVLHLGPAPAWRSCRAPSRPMQRVLSIWASLTGQQKLNACGSAALLQLPQILLAAIASMASSPRGSKYTRCSPAAPKIPV